jgi:NitT/TauT family transport system substrate-binding protein
MGLLRSLRSSPRRLVTLAALGVLSISALGAAAACGGSDSSSSSGQVNLRLGFFPNLTHASALVGVDKGIFAQKLGSNVKLDVKTFNAGPAATEALFSGAIDATYIGPNPTVNGFAKSKGQALRVISGSASGGVAFVVKPSITKPEDLKGKKIATPQLGNTQDVALRYWLKQHGLTATKEGGGDVSVKPQDNSVTLQTFASGAIDGAWVPEPWVSQLVAKGGHVLVDERTLWPDGKFVITNLIVRTDFLKAHPDVVKKLLEGQVAANDYIHSNPTEAQQAVSDEIGKITGKPLDVKLITTAWPTLDFLNDPIASSLTTGAKHAEEIGLLDAVNLNGLYDLGPLNDVLKAQGKTEVSLP